MNYRIQLSPYAARQLRKLDPTSRRRVQAAIDLLGGNPRPPAAKRLVGGGDEWRVRTGDYRIIYEIHDGELMVLVLRTGHRREVYERAELHATPLKSSQLTLRFETSQAKNADSIPVARSK